nr:hypothetical protein [uncultured Draconibacterium sp.]
MKNHKLIIFLLLLLNLVACRSVKTDHWKTSDQQGLYQLAIENAMAPTPNKVCSDLVIVTSDNNNLVWKNIQDEAYLLVVAWKQNVSYYEPYLDSSSYNTGDYPIWVTTAPELLRRMKSEKVEDVDLRLKQLLGLPPNSVYSYFVEMWVSPSDLFRPCPDPEVDDSRCELCFPADTDSSHIEWINANRISRYYPCELYDKYPWSQLGYTYDWNANNTSHVGLSEFVIGNNKNIFINAIYTTAEYLGKEISSE